MEYDLDILGQQPLLNLYTQITLAYPVDGASSHSAIIATLQSGLERLSSHFPWVAAQVVQEGANESSSGVFKMVPFQPHASLVVKDLCHDPSVPTFAWLHEAKFPYSAALLDESCLAPRRTLPGDPNEPPSRPVLLVQATFIRGGMLLTVVAHHMTMDMMGQGQVMSLLSKACRQEPFTQDELTIGNMPRSQSIPSLETFDKAALDHQIAKPPSSSASDAQPPPPPPPPPPKSTWVYFSFDAPSLAALKADASTTVPSGFISTDDALSALIWQATMRARQPRLANSAAVQATLSRAVDVRQSLGLPLTYPGVVQNMTYSTATVQEIVEQPLGVLASRLRSALVDPKVLAHSTRALATLMRNTPNKASVSVTATIDTAKDIMLSSWVKVDAQRLDFGLGLGSPVAVRRPMLAPFESLMYLMPKTAQGEIAAAICLRDEDLDRLKADPAFLKYAQYIG